jgi:glucose-6-phosphate isomerase
VKIGNEFKLHDDGTLQFISELTTHPEPDIRCYEDAAHVFMNQIDLPGDTPLYYMYRNSALTKHEELFQQAGIRYDLTVILPKKIGQEFNKTIGHFHPNKPNSSESYPEYYEVLAGEALYILQKNSRSGDVEEIMAVEAKVGDKVYIPPSFGHVTINPSNQPLVMANLIESTFNSIYESFAQKKGAAYYFVETENGKCDFIKNPHYHNSVGLKITAAPNLTQPIQLVKDKTLYEHFIDNPRDFDLLK